MGGSQPLAASPDVPLTFSFALVLVLAQNEIPGEAETREASRR